MATTYPYRPDYATPPGWTLEETIDELSMSQADLARRTGLSTKHINQIMRGKAAITTDTARRLEHVTGVPDRIWNNLESRYQEHQARLAEEVELADHVDLLDKLPVSAMVTLKLLTPRAGRVTRLKECLAFFGVSNPDALDATMTHLQAAFRKSRSHESDDNAIAVWLRMGEIDAAQLDCAPWNIDRFREALVTARGLTRETDPAIWHPALVEACARAGVCLVVTPQVKGARTHGATRWLRADKALIQMSLHHSWSDIFWFTFFHEAKHVLNGSRRAIYIEQRDGTGANSDEERQADTFATNFLIPRDRSPDLRRVHSLQDVEELADELGIHPGIVVGRLHHERIWPHDRGNGLRERLELNTSIS